MRLLDDCQNISLVRQEVELFCDELGLDWSSQASTNWSFISEALLESRNHQFLDMTLERQLCYVQESTNTLATRFPYASSLRKYFYEHLNVCSRKFMEREVKGIIKDEERSKQHWFLVELAQINEQLLKSSFTMLNENKMMHPKQSLQKYTLLFDDISHYYANIYHNRLFFKTKYESFFSMEPKPDTMEMLVQFGLLSSYQGLNRYLALMIEHLEISSGFSVVSIGYQYKDIAILKIPPALLYVMRSLRYFYRRQTNHLVNEEELAVYTLCCNSPFGAQYKPLITRQHAMPVMQFRQIEADLNDVVLTDIVMQLGLKIEYDILTQHLPNICRFFINKAKQHEGWQVGVYQDREEIQVMWRNKEQHTVRVYPFLLQLALFLNEKMDSCDMSSISRPELLAGLNKRIPEVQRLIDTMNEHRRSAVIDFMNGEKSYIDSLENKTKELFGTVQLAPKEIESLMFCSEYAKENVAGASVLLKFVGANCYENPQQLTIVLDEMRMVRRLEGNSQVEEMSPKRKNTKKAAKKENIQLQFKKLTGIAQQVTPPVAIQKEEKTTEQIPKHATLTKTIQKEHPAQAQPLQAQPVVSQPLEAKHAQAQPAEAKPVDLKPVEVQPPSAQITSSRLQEPITIGVWETDNPQMLDLLNRSVDRSVDTPARTTEPPMPQQIVKKSEQSKSIIKPGEVIKPSPIAKPIDKQTSFFEKLDTTETTMNSSIMQKHETSIVVVGENAPIQEEFAEDVQQEPDVHEAYQDTHLRHTRRISDSVQQLDTVNPTIFKSIFRRKRHKPHFQKVNPEQTTPERSEAADSIIRILTNNLNTVHSKVQLAKHLLLQQQLVDRAVDFNTKKEWYSEAKQQKILFGLIEDMYRQLRSHYAVEWTNDDMPRKLQQVSLPQTTRSASLRDLRRVKDMPIETAVNTILQKKLQVSLRPAIKVPAPNNLFYAN